MVRVFHFADVHIGVETHGRTSSNGLNSRVNDFLHSLDSAIDQAIAQGADVAVCAGDLYKTANPSQTHQRELAERLVRLAQAMPLVLLVGNHDSPATANRVSSLTVFDTLQVPNIIVADRPDLYRIETASGPCEIVTLPYPSRRNLAALDQYKNASLAEQQLAVTELASQAVNALALKADPDIPTILTAHCSVYGAEQGAERLVALGQDAGLNLGTLANPAFDYVALGHIHKHQSLNWGQHPPVCYSGSIDRVDFGEANEPKGFIIADVTPGATDWRFVQVPGRPFIDLDINVTESDSPMDTIWDHIEAMADPFLAIVRIRIRALQDQLPELDLSVFDAPLELADNVIGPKIETVKAERRRVAPGVSFETLSPMETLAVYLESKGISEKKIASLTQYATEIMEE